MPLEALYFSGGNQKLPLWRVANPSRGIWGIRGRSEAKHGRPLEAFNPSRGTENTPPEGRALLRRAAHPSGGV